MAPRTMRLAARADRLLESATLQTTRRALELRAAGRDIVDWGAGEPGRSSPAAAIAGARAALERGLTRYTVASGPRDLRVALAARYRRDYGAPYGGDDDTLITVGAKAALFQVALALLEPGDEVVLPVPAWVSLGQQAEFAGARVVAVSMREEENFAHDADRLLGALSPRTRALLLNAPCNPTGGVIAEDALEHVLATCAQRGVVVIADETYERFVWDGRSPVSASAFAGQFPNTVVVVGSFSKTYAMTGWRVGYLLGPPWLVAAATRVQGHAVTHPTTFAMAGAHQALDRAEADVTDMLAEYAACRRQMVAGLLELPGVRCRLPAGSFYAFVNVSALLGPATPDPAALAERWLEQAGVAVVPGSAFGSDHHVRVSFACGALAIAEGLRRLRLALGGGSPPPAGDQR